MATNHDTLSDTSGSVYNTNASSSSSLANGNGGVETSTTSSSLSSYEFVLPVQFSNQLQLTWCGPAVMQMVLNSIVFQFHGHLINSGTTTLTAILPSQEELLREARRIQHDPNFVIVYGITKPRSEGVPPEEIALVLTLHERKLSERLRSLTGNPFEPIAWRVIDWDPKEEGIDEKMSKVLMAVVKETRRPIIFLTFYGKHYVLCSGFRSNVDPTTDDNNTTKQSRFDLEAMTILDPLEPDLCEDLDNEWKMRDNCWSEFVTPAEHGRCVAIIPTTSMMEPTGDAPTVVLSS